MIRILAIGVAGLAILATGCAPQKDSEVVTADHDNVCEVKRWERSFASEACKPGQKVIFLPPSWGNEQMPLLFVAVNCDMRFSVSLTNGGVVCIYRPIKVAENSESKEKR